MSSVKNPILRGFNPDPSMVFVEGEFYLAVSTFEWFPGITIYRSDNLADWNFVAAPLEDDTVIDLTGIDTACGIWAPNLTYQEGTFYLLYTIVYTNRPRYKDTHNFLITAKDIKGPWSAPVPLNCTGFDPSLFHDNGKKWLVNMTIDHRVEKERFSGIDIQEYDEEKKELVGEVYKIFKGSPIGKTEGPNMIKHGEYYYLTVAEGGTEFEHCVTMARSKQITGPYEIHPENPVLTSKTFKEDSLQRAGHGQLIQDNMGNWYMAHLCSRPVGGYSILGRETAIQNIVYMEDGWFRLAKGGNTPFEYFEIPDTNSKITLGKETQPMKSRIQEFDTGERPWEFMSLRKSALHTGCSFTERKGWLRIHGGNSLSSKYKQGLLARRVESLESTISTKMEFTPRKHQHMAGLVVYYNYDNYHYLKISKDEILGKCINITTVNNREITETTPIAIEDNGEAVFLKAVMGGEALEFYYSLNSNAYIKIGNILDMRIISDEHVNGNGFTGAMVGVCCQDLCGDGVYADYDWFWYNTGKE